MMENISLFIIGVLVGAVAHQMFVVEPVAARYNCTPKYGAEAELKAWEG